MNNKMALFSSRENLNKSQNVKLQISLKTYNIFNDIVIAQQSLPPTNIQQYFPSVNVSKKFEQTLQKCRRKRTNPNLKMKAIENVIVAKHEMHNNSPMEKRKENLYTEVKYSENNEIIGLRNNRRASELVDQLLLDIYGRTNYTSGKLFDTEYGSSTSFKSVAEKFDENMQYGRLVLKDTAELRVLIGALVERVTYAGNLLVKQLKKREALGSKQEKLCNVITAHLQAFSSKRSEDTNMRFSPTPVPGDSGFSQWRDAMKMVAKLPGGIPPEFRKKLWLALAEKHLQSKGVNWSQTERLCFNEWSNPDDNELGVQIVKDLHRTGCSLFCGAAGQENQALLKRVLLAYARWNKSVGYCQGFNMLAALILQVMDKSEIDSVKVMIYLIEGVLPESYFANNLRGLSVDMVVFRDLLRMRLPQLSKHLEALQNDAREGNSYEPPLTNVFTMQWFLTLFCNCLPQSTVLRVWDLIFLEGNEILLRTAIAIWEKLSDRILAVNSADEFYSIMGVLTREMLEFGLVDSNTLVKSIVAIGACAELNDMRDRYLYNITPWTQSVQTAAKKGFKLFYSDDDDAESDNDEKAAVTAVYGMSIGRKKERTMSGNVIQPYAHGHPDRERLALDISALKKQYAKLRERQRQAHIILQAACARQPMGQNTTPPPIAMNHLLLGKNAIVNARGRRLGPPKGAIPPLRTREPMRKQQQGETIHWKDTAKIRYPRRSSYVEENEDSKDTFAPDSDSSSYSEDDSSSTSTELCDEPERLSDFDSDDKFVPSSTSIVDTVRTTKELKNTINSEKFSTEDNLNKSEASACIISEPNVQDITTDNEEFKTINNEDNLFSEFKSCAVVNKETVDECFELKSTNEETVATGNSELDLCKVISESTIKISELETDIFSNPVFYSEFCSRQDTSASDLKDYIENDSTITNEFKSKHHLDNIEENQDKRIDVISSIDTEFNVYKFENLSDLKTSEESKICKDTVSMTAEENALSSDRNNFTGNEIATLETKSETNYFNSSPVKSFANFEALSKTMVSSNFDDQKNNFEESLDEKSVPELKEHSNVSPIKPMYNFESSNADISSQLLTSDRKSLNTETASSSNTISDTNEEKIEHSQILELSENKYYADIELTPAEESISRITSIPSEKNDKIQAMLNENSDILKGYQIAGEEKRNSELKSDETKSLNEKTKENYLLKLDSKETNAILISKNEITPSTPKISIESSNFEVFLEEQVKLLKQNSSDVTSPKEDTYTWRASEEKLRRHKSYEETTKNYMDRSTFYKQTSFDVRSFPIEEFPKWTPYQFEENLNKEHEAIQVDTKTEQESTSTMDTFEETVKIDTSLAKTPIKEESSEAIVVREETPEWIPYNFEENAIKHEEKQAHSKAFSKSFNRFEESKVNEENIIKQYEENPADTKAFSKSLNRFEESEVNEENRIKIDVNLAETPVKEEICKETLGKQPSIDLLSVDDTRLEAGRKNSARALKIIQENSLILHRILQHSKSSDKEDSEDELSRSPISKTFKSESLLSREERTDEDRSSRDGEEDLESGTEFSLSPAVFEEDNDGYIRKSTIDEENESYIRKSTTEDDLEDKFIYEYRTTNENVYEKFANKLHQIKPESFSSFTHTDESNNREKRPFDFTFENKDITVKPETKFSFQNEFSSEFQQNEANNITNDKEMISTKCSSQNEDNFEILPEISSSYSKKLSAIDSRKDETAGNQKLERRYSSWHEEMSPDVPTLSKKQYSSFSCRSPEGESNSYGSFRANREDSSTLYFQKSPEEIKAYDSSEYNLDKYKLPCYSGTIKEESDINSEFRGFSQRINKETHTNIESRGYSLRIKEETNDGKPVDLNEDTSISTRLTNYEANDEETTDNNVYSTDKHESSAQSYSSQAYTEFQYDKNRLTIDLSSPGVSKDYSPEISPPKHLSCLQFTTFQTDIPCTSKSLQFSPICVKDKSLTASPTTASPTCSNNKYSFNLPTLSPPKRSAKSPLSPAKSFSPFPVQPTTRQPKEVGVRLGLYKDLSPLKSPAK